MSTVVRNQKVEESAAITFPLFNLPTELVEKVILQMSEEEREILHSHKHDSLNEVSLKAGHLRFHTIEFNANFASELTASGQELAVLFRHAQIDELKISGAMDWITMKKLQNAFKSAHFQRLNIEIDGESTNRLLAGLIRDRKMIDEVRICWNKNTESAKNILMDLPAMRKCTIESLDELIDDDVLLHVVKNSSDSIHLNCANSTVTARGLEAAFEMVYKSTTTKQVHSFAPSAEVHQLFSQLNEQFVVADNWAQHVESGAYLMVNHPFPGEDVHFVWMYNGEIEETCDL